MTKQKEYSWVFLTAIILSIIGLLSVIILALHAIGVI